MKLTLALDLLQVEFGQSEPLLLGRLQLGLGELRLVGRGRLILELIAVDLLVIHFGRTRALGGGRLRRRRTGTLCKEAGTAMKYSSW